MKTKSTLLLSALFAVPGFLLAETYTATTTASGTINSSWNNATVWDNGIPPSATDTVDTDIVLGTNAGTGNGTAMSITLAYNPVGADYKISSLTAKHNGATTLNLQSDFTVTGELSRYGIGGNQAFTINGANYNVTLGSLSDNGHFGGTTAGAAMMIGDYTTAVKSVRITGNAVLGGSQLKFNATNGVVIDGYVDLAQRTSNANKATGSLYININRGGTAKPVTSSLRVGGIKGGDGVAYSGGIYAGGDNNNSRYNSGHLTFTGFATDTSFAGTVADSAIAGGTGKLHIIMDASNSNFTQEFTAQDATNNTSTISYTGNTVLTQGNLKLNAAKTSIGAVYLGYDTADIRDATTDTVDMSQLASHGISDAQTSLIFAGSGATITSLNWSSGVLGFDLDGVATGEKVLTIGGVIDFSSSADKFLFDFQNIDAEITYTLLSLQGVSVDGQAIDITDEAVRNAILAKLDSNEGQGFAFDLATGTLTFQAGIYIPEPSTYAAIFGAMAFAFAAYRRKRA